MQAMILSTIRTTLITAGTGWALTHGIDQGTVEAIVGAAVALGAGIWGAWNGWKTAKQPK